MDSRVLFSRDDLKILNCVVVLVAVDMVHDLVAPQRASEMRLHHDAVLVAAVELLVCRLFQLAEFRLSQAVVLAAQLLRGCVGWIAVPPNTLRVASAHSAAAFLDRAGAAFDQTQLRRQPAS